MEVAPARDGVSGGWRRLAVLIPIIGVSRIGFVRVRDGLDGAGIPA
jgi:hypothetical protein